MEDQTVSPLAELRPQTVALVTPASPKDTKQQKQIIATSNQKISANQKTAIPKKEVDNLVAIKSPVADNTKTLTPPKAVRLPAPKQSAIIFKIQLAASPAELETSNQKWSKIPFIEVRKENNLYKYLTGNHTNYDTAIQNRNSALSKGFNGAFIVAYKNGQRISLQAAKTAVQHP